MHTHMQHGHGHAHAHAHAHATCYMHTHMHMQHVPTSHLVSELDRSIHFIRIPNPIIPASSPGARRPRDARHVRRTREDPSGRQAAPRYCQALVRPPEGLVRLQPSVVGCESQAPTTSCGCSRVSAPSCRGGEKQEIQRGAMFLFFSRLPRRAAAAGRKRNTARRVSFLGFRAELLRLGADILWDARVESLILQGGEGGAEGEGAAEGGGGVGSAAGGGGGGGGVGCGGVAGVVLRVLSGTLGRSPRGTLEQL